MHDIKLMSDAVAFFVTRGSKFRDANGNRRGYSEFFRVFEFGDYYLLFHDDGILEVMKGRICVYVSE